MFWVSEVENDIPDMVLCFSVEFIWVCYTNVFIIVKELVKFATMNDGVNRV